MDSIGNSRVVRFGSFKADLETGELRKDGVKLALQVQPFQVLAILLQNAGGLVTREQLKSQVWPKDTFVDFDHALNTAITKIRLAVGDDAEHPKYIETLPRRGYRFIGTVEKDGIDRPDVLRSGRSRRLWIAAGSLLALAVFIAAIAFWRARQKADAASSSIEVVPLVSLPGVQAFPAVSPDGNQVAFAQFERKHDIFAGQDGAIYTALIGGDKPLQLTAKAGACCSTWSPDGRQIAFLRVANGERSINVISALGGAEQRLYTQTGVGCLRLDWSPDGKSLVFGQSADNGLHSRIALLSLDDLKVRTLTNPSPQDDECEATFSPDGSMVAFARGGVGGLGRDVFVVPVTGGEARRITFDNAWFASCAWTRDGKEIVFASNRGGPVILWRVSAMGGVPTPVPGVKDSATHPSISRKGNLLAYEHFGYINSIWRLDLKDETHAGRPPSRAIASRGVFNWSPDVSPDGKKVVFQSDRLGYSDIWYCDTDGSNCTQLTSLHGTAGGAHWSPDGHQVVFEFQKQSYYDIYVVEVPGGRPRLIQTFPGSDNGLPSWSRDGKWIYFYSSHDPGPLQLWKVPAQGGTPVRVTRNGGRNAMESEDGRFVYYWKSNQPGIWRTPLNGGEEQRVWDQPAGSPRALSRNGVYFIDGDPDGKLQFFDFRTRKATLIAHIDKPAPGLALSPDGKSLFFSRNESEVYEIMLVKNFH